MTDVVNRLDEIEQKVMSGLKDFQRATVERIDSLYRQGQKRVLVSDEVGLGKTLIARGVIAKLAQLQKEQQDELVRVVYVCSNSAIADQNLEKLMISQDVSREATNTSRLSMQHLNIFMQEGNEELYNRYVQLIPLTPDTSFRMTSGAGSADERALMYAILRRSPLFDGFQKQLNVAMMDWATKGWNYYRNRYEENVLECEKQTDGRYLSYMLPRVEQELLCPREGEDTYLEQMKELFGRIRSSGNIRVNHNDILGKLRVAFAQISLDKLEPDLVIMDEFQRFPSLIKSDESTETGMLAHRFFHSDTVRMLLLSATPYKMYSTLDEIDENPDSEHYREFLEVMHFLNGSEVEDQKFRTVWNNYSVKLKELTQGDITILQAKEQAENSLYSHICRTERVSASEGADMIDAHEVKIPIQVEPRDITAYLQMQGLLDDIRMSAHVPVDYVKSCPYLLSFMKDYKLKQYIEAYFRKNPDQISKANRDALWLKRQDFMHYDPIDPGNARLADVMAHAFEDGADKLLWVPPSRPYYAPSGVYRGVKHFTKTLIFSSWEMVPRMVSCMLSYEAERRTIGVLAEKKQERDAQYFHTGEKRFPLAKLNFSVSKDGPGAMTLFCLLYPSKFLADCYDPLDCMNRGLSLEKIQEELRQKIQARLLEKCPDYGKITSGNEDKRWYYMAPLFMDHESYVKNWLNECKPLENDEEKEEQKKKDKKKGFTKHMAELRQLYFSRNAWKLGKLPKNLLDVLVTMSIASPAVCAYRTYQQYASLQYGQRYWPSETAKTFINRMNSPESTAVIEVCYGESEDAHWLNVLNYCKDGNLQAVFDEYAHLLTNGLEQNETLLERLHGYLNNSMNLRSVPYRVDTHKNLQARVTGQTEKPVNIRTHFAVSFIKGEGDGESNRKKNVRNAFNSPFRPFVLATTSIGQEGLDFHNYCRRIVHWNLPSNPIDLEQREGRINRFECLAIRQNVADRYGNIQFHHNIWQEMFEEAARQEKTAGSSDLIPYWGLTERENMVRIERIVPMYPFSRDELSYERLIKILSLYRLTLGQARQEELLEYIFQNVENPENLKELFINLSPFYKKNL